MNNDRLTYKIYEYDFTKYLKMRIGVENWKNIR